MCESNASATNEKKGIKLAYQGAKAYRALLANCGKEGRSEADARMHHLAKLVDCVGVDETGPELPFEVVAWAIETGDADLFEDYACEITAVDLAEKGYAPARFLVSKMELIGYPWEMGGIVHTRGEEPMEMRRASKKWLRELATSGYVDACVELAFTLWGSNRNKARMILEKLTPFYPEAQLRLGHLMLGEDPKRAIQLIDEAEMRINDRGYSYLEKLNQDLTRLKYE